MDCVSQLQNGRRNFGGGALGGALAQPRIEWEIANRFRLFRDEAQFRRLAEIYAALPAADRRERPAFAFEEAMQGAAAARTLGPAFGDSVSVARWGWTSAVTRRTCFQNGNRGHWQCLLDTGDQFMEPRVADLLVRIAGLPPALAGKTCRWTAASLPCPPPAPRRRGLRAAPSASPSTSLSAPRTLRSPKLKP